MNEVQELSSVAEARPRAYALAGAPALIERLLPAQKLSAEAQKERKAVAGQTLTALGSYWKGRKPLILARACILGALLPATDDPEADLAVFEKLMAMDDEAFLRRLTSFSAAEIVRLARTVQPLPASESSAGSRSVERDMKSWRNLPSPSDGSATKPLSLPAR